MNSGEKEATDSFIDRKSVVEILQQGGRDLTPEKKQVLKQWGAFRESQIEQHTDESMRRRDAIVLALEHALVRFKGKLTDQNQAIQEVESAADQALDAGELEMESDLRTLKHGLGEEDFESDQFLEAFTQRYIHN